MKYCGRKLPNAVALSVVPKFYTVTGMSFDKALMFKECLGHMGTFALTQEIS